MASSRLITRYDGLRSTDHSMMDMVHQVDDGNKEPYSGSIQSTSNVHRDGSSNASTSEDYKTVKRCMFG